MVGEGVDSTGGAVHVVREVNIPSIDFRKGGAGESWWEARMTFPEAVASPGEKGI